MANIIFSERISKIKPSATIATADKARELEKKGIKIIRMETGEPHNPTPESIKKAAIKALNENKVFYSHSKGIIELRTAVCGWYNKKCKKGLLKLDPEKNIIITPGGKQAILYVLLSILNEKDEVIIPTPAWVSYFDMTRIAGGIPIEAACNEKSNFSLDLKTMASKVSSRTRAIIINNPNNPTGHMLSEKELADMHKLCREKNILMIMDEIYDSIVFDSNRHNSILDLDSSLQDSVLIHGFSKSYSMTGWRLGYALASESMISAMTKMQQHSATHPVTFVQYGGIEALNSGNDFMMSSLKEYQENKDYIISEIIKMKKFSAIPPMGGLYVFINIKKTGKSSTEFCIELLEKSYIATVPGNAFGESGEGYIRICLATKKENLVKLMQTLKEEYES